MNFRRHALETITLIVAAALCALISNAVAARERKLVLVGFYPNAQKVPAQTAEPPASAVVPPQAATTTATAPVVQAPATTTQPAAPAMTTTLAPATTAAPQPRGTALPPPASQPRAAAIAQPAPQPANPKPTFTPHPDKPYLEISYNDVAALHAALTLFLDARRTSIYEQGHIAGARPFSVWESDIDDKVRKLFDERGDPREQARPIVVYCSGGDCEDSHMLAQKLWGIQFNNVYVYKDGYPDWVAHRGATNTGSNP